MEVKFHGWPTLRGVCRITTGEAISGGGGVHGCQLKAEFNKQGRSSVIRKVLIIDDDPPTLRALPRIARNLSLEFTAFNPVEQKANADQTVSFAKSNDFDLIVVDGRMGMITGYTIVEKLRAAGYAGHIVANSSYPEENEHMTARGADFMIEDKDIYRFPDFFQP